MLGINLFTTTFVVTSHESVFALQVCLCTAHVHVGQRPQVELNAKDAELKKQTNKQTKNIAFTWSAGEMSFYLSSIFENEMLTKRGKTCTRKKHCFHMMSLPPKCWWNKFFSVVFWELDVNQTGDGGYSIVFGVLGREWVLGCLVAIPRWQYNVDYTLIRERWPFTE